MDFPNKIYLQESSIYTESISRGIQEVIISYEGRLDVTPEAHINSYNPGNMNFTSLTILNGGLFHQSSARPTELKVVLHESLTITSGGTMNISVLTLKVSNLYVDGGALLTAHERGFPSGEGLSPGKISSLSASGAGHGGAGGRGKQSVVGMAYGDFDKPRDSGSGGGQGYKNLVEYIFI